MIIAIFGASRVGKTSSARPLSREFGFSLRSCGDELKQRTTQAQINGDVPDEIHRQLDAETVDWASVNDRMHRIIEGRFLNYVLTDLSPAPYLIHLTADPIVRLRRLADPKVIDVAGIASLDVEDERFCNRLYSGDAPLKPNVSIDTSNTTVESCVDLISELVRAKLQLG